ncbi:rhamnogalacturonan acetylesterase [Sphingomonas sp. PR090111-T3T-6A]|uniref:rhamnogalacturonan acetylesterase n=1 Tax=Sphingomonas sp. PR090111-T3T-6A TaxID=685778 RepID=UPI00036A0163|nr:rhamnogalacturonan acetylesterase [Sphingomonas sp. PR090111-T3T-6A]
MHATPALAEPLWRLSLDGSAAKQGFTPVPAGQPYRAGGVGYEPGSRADALLLSAVVPEGLYRVTVTFGAGRTTVKAESRRLMLLDVVAKPGESVTRSFLVAVRTPALAPPPLNAPGGDHVRIGEAEAKAPDWDDRLTLEFLGQPHVKTVTIEPATAPTIFLAGDSTVTDQPSEPAASWGQMLPALLDDKVAVANHAWSGETLKSFLTALRLDKLLSQAKQGDWLLIQFGHNDQKTQWPQTFTDPVHTYPAYLKAYIAEARRRGITPVLVTPPERRNFGADGKLVGTLDDYVAAMRKVAADEHVALIDLNAASRAIYEALGPERAPLAFNDGGRDKTHNDNYGAWLLANAVAEQLAKVEPSLAAHIAPGAVRFDPAKPPLPEQIHIPESIARSNARPAGN